MGSPTDNTKLFTYTQMGIRILCALAHLVIGIFTVLVSSSNRDAKEACGLGIWWCLIFISISHFIRTIDSIREFIYIKSDDEYDHSFSISLMSGMYVWATVAYYKATNKCEHLYKANYADVWLMLYINVISFYVILAISFIEILIVLKKKKGILPEGCPSGV